MGWSRHALVFVLCFFGVVLAIPHPVEFLTDEDWGFQLAGANQILAGGHPFIDFQNFYGPLTPYASAWVQHLTGERPLGEIGLSVLGYTLAYVLLFYLTFRITENFKLALIVTLLALILIPRMYKYYIVLAPMMTLATVWWYLHKPNKFSLFLASATIVIAGLFRQDYGFYYAVTATIVVYLKTRSLKEVVLGNSFIFLTALPWLVFVSWHGGLDDYFYDSTFGTSGMASGVRLPIPQFDFQQSPTSRQNATFVFFTFFQCVPLVSLWVWWKKKAGLEVLSLILVAQLSLIQGWHRIDYQHILQVIPASFILCGWLAKTALDSDTRLAKLGIGMLVGMAAYILISFPMEKYHPTTLVENIEVYAQPRDVFFDSVAEQYPDLPHVKVIQYLQDCTPPQSSLAAYNRLTSLYYFSNRLLAGGVVDISPSSLSPEEEQDLIEQLRLAPPPVFVDRVGFAYDNDPERAFAQYMPDLTRYLYQEYQEVRRFDSLVMLVHRDQDFPNGCLFLEGD